MSGTDPTALESILPEVHDIFSERAAERDLAIIKKVKKVDADTRQIVTNREAEIKEVVRGEPRSAFLVLRRLFAERTPRDLGTRTPPHALFSLPPLLLLLPLRVVCAGLTCWQRANMCWAVLQLCLNGWRRMRMPLNTMRSSGTPQTESRWLRRRSGSSRRRLSPLLLLFASICSQPISLAPCGAQLLDVCACLPLTCCRKDSASRRSTDRLDMPLLQIEDMTVDKENTQTQVQALRTDILQMQHKQQQVETEVLKEMPQNKVH